MIKPEHKNIFHMFLRERSKQTRETGSFIPVRSVVTSSARGKGGKKTRDKQIKKKKLKLGERFRNFRKIRSIRVIN